MATYSPTRLTADGEVLGTGDVVVLTPEEWLGKPFPLIPYSDFGDQLSHGAWNVLVYREKCDKCRIVLDAIVSRDVRNDVAMEQGIALLELPPFDATRSQPDPFNAAPLHGRLLASSGWHMETPLLLELRDGFVFRVIRGDKVLPAIEAL